MLQRVVHPSGLVVYRSPALERLGLAHAFTTRVGPGGEPFDLAAPGGPALTALLEAAGAPDGAVLVHARQVHGTTVLDAAELARRPDAAADALVGDSPDRLLLAYAADCAPILVATADGRRVSAIHAGWRGLVAGVVDAALDRLGAPAAVAAIGPCLSVEHCEMGPEVVDAFRAAELGAAIDERPGRRARVDVRAAARIALERRGVATLDVSDRCTWRDADEFPSHRRDVTHGGAARTTRIGGLIAAQGPR